MMTNHDQKQVRAYYTDDFIRVYQAYNDSIATNALEHGTFTQPSFSFSRMTWIKPSFCWMMYRCGWGYKDEGQRNILAVDITHEGFAWCLKHASLSKPHPNQTQAEYEARKEICPVVIQWDPERDMFLNKLDYRSIQIGIKGEAVEKYAHEWIVNITNITDECQEMKRLIDNDEIDKAKLLLPNERIYPIDKADYPFIF